VATLVGGDVVTGGIVVALGAVIGVVGAVWVERPFAAQLVDAVGLLIVGGAVANSSGAAAAPGVQMAVAGVGVILLAVGASLRARPYASGFGLAGVGVTVIGFGWGLTAITSVGPAAGTLVIIFGILLLAAGGLVAVPGTRGRNSLPARLLVGWGDDLVEKLERLRHEDDTSAAGP
jgi:hypothetical protein